MKICWDNLAKKNGFSGMYMAKKSKVFLNKGVYGNCFIYEPEFSGWGRRRAIENRIQKYTGITIKNRKPVKYMYDYDVVWKRIIRNEKKNKSNLIPGCFVTFDDTPRRGKNARIVTNDSPERFYENFKKFYQIVKENKREILLMTAWNEWGEGAYLEPDMHYGYAYLEALKKVLSDVWYNK